MKGTGPGRKHSAEQVRQRRDVVEECLVRGDWTLRRQAQVAASFNVTESQVRKDATAIRREWAAQEQEQTQDEIRSDWRQRVHKAIREASERGHDVTVAKLLATEARVLGLEAPQVVEVSHTVHTIQDAPRLAADVLRALPIACDLLGIEAPALPIIDVDTLEIEHHENNE
tara:strand:- start:142 stop:654 length:513 start_codon:yes stop_codon:yes gene_type:complete